MKLGIIKNKSNIMLLCLLASIAFAYTCSSPTGSGDGGNPPNPCLTDPFGSTCGDDFLQARVNDCITAGNASETRCEAIFTEDSASANTCLTNPFADACSIANGAFTSYADTARTNRVTFCNANSGNSLCSQITTCETTPFASTCESYFEPKRTDRLTFCTTVGNENNANCSATKTSTTIRSCIDNPFANTCSVANGVFTPYANTTRTNRVSFCVDETENTSLCPTLVRTCIATPFAGECTDDVFSLTRFNACEERQNVAGCVNTGDLPTYETKPNEVTGSGFLMATDTGLNTVDISFSDSMLTIVIPHFIGRRGGAGTNESPNTNRDGFAHFATNVMGGSTSVRGYAGILPKTNLGAPLTAQPANAVWAGHFSEGVTTNIATNFYIDFTTGRFGFSNAGGNGADGTLRINNVTYTMNAVFGSHTDATGFNAGRIGGTLDRNDGGFMDSSPIVGLIGEEGMVGVFVKVGEDNGATGGFTATNPSYTPPE